MNTIKKISKNTQSGFTLLEILLVVAAIGILAGIVIFAINPGKQLADTRNAQRKVDVNTILNAIHQYSIDNNGTVPGGLSILQKEICRTEATSCTDLYDLSVLTTDEKYLTAMPVDPLTSNPNSTGYSAALTAGGRVIIRSSYAEGPDDISATR